MRRSASYSAVLHVVIVLLAFFGLPSLFTPDEPIERPIPVELYTVEDETVLPPPDLEPVAEPEAEAVPVPPEPEVAEEFIPTPSEPVPAPPAPPEPEVATAPEPAPPAPEPAPKLAVPEQSDIPPPPPPKPSYVATAEPAPEVVPEAKPEPSADPFASLLKSIEEAARDAPTLEAAMPEANAAEAPLVTAPTTTLSDEPLSLSVLDAIRRQVEDNWSLPAGATGAADLAVEIEIVLLPDGTVRSASIVDTARLNQAGEEFFRSMAESAIRAVRRASPLRNLPPEKYEQWREITFRFTPPV